MSISDEILMAFVDGELDEATRHTVEAAERNDPDVRRRLASHRRLRSRLQNAFAPVLEEPVPERLLDAARRPDVSVAMVGKPARSLKSARIVASRFSISAWPAFGSLAASILVGIGLGYVIWHGSDEFLRTASDGGMVASGTLARALSTQIAAEPSSSEGAVIGLSFLSKSGAYCRTFSLAKGRGSAGLACRDDGQWRIQLLAPSGNDGGEESAYRMAGSNFPAPLRSLVESEINGEPLTREQEKAARQGGWRVR